VKKGCLEVADRGQENNAVFAAKNVITDGKDLWMLSNDTDVLLHFDFASLRLLDYHIMPGKILTQHAHLGLVKGGNIIYIVPYMENTLVSFDCITGKMENINIPYETGEIRKKGKFNIIAIWKNQLVLIGHAIKGIFYYDIVSQSFTRDIEYLDELEKAGCDVNVVLFSDCYCQKDNKLYIPIFYKNMILEIDLEKNINKIHKLKHEEPIRLRTIDRYEENGKEKFLLTTVNDEMLIWSPAGGIEKWRKLGLLRSKEGMYMRAYHVRKKNYYIAAEERKVFVEEDDEIRELEFEYESRGGAKEAAGGTQFEAIFKNGKDIFFQARSNGQLFRIDTAADMICRIDFDVASEKREEIIDRVCNSRPVCDTLIENMWFGLDSFLKVYVDREEK